MLMIIACYGSDTCIFIFAICLSLSGVLQFASARDVSFDSRCGVMFFVGALSVVLLVFFITVL